MLNKQGFKHFSRGLIGFCLVFVILGLGSTVALSQAAPPASQLNSLCRQVNPTSAPGLVAYFSPSTERRISTADGHPDGPGANEAVYLTGPQAEISADGSFIRVWFKSLEPNYKVGWIATKFNNQGSLKLGDNRWRAANCNK